MALESLTAVLTAQDELSDALSEIGREAATAAQALSKTDTETDDAKESLRNIATTATEANLSFENLQNSVRSAGRELSDASGEMNEVTAASVGTSAGLQSVASSANRAGESVEDMNDEVEEAARDMMKATGAAQSFSLATSSLSVSIGSFTVALKDLGTQIPIIITVLGNTVAAFTAVAGAAAFAAAGIAAVFTAGLLATAEDMSGSLQDTEETMKALKAIGITIKDVLLEAFRPLIEAEGVAQAFMDIIEGIANTIRVFSQSIAAMFSNAQDEIFTLKDFMDEVGGAFSDNLMDITEAFMTLFTEVGPRLSDFFSFLIQNLDKFINFSIRIFEGLDMIMQSITDTSDGLIKNLTLVGQKIAGGVAPIAGTFVTILSDIIALIKEMDNDLIALVLQVTVLAFAFNKLASIMSAVIAPFSVLTVAIGSAAGATGGLVGGFKAATSAFGTFLSTGLGGFSDLVGAISAFVPVSLTASGSAQTLGKSIKSNLFFNKVVSSFQILTNTIVGGFAKMASSLGFERIGKMALSMNIAINESAEEMRELSFSSVAAEKSIESLIKDLLSGSVAAELFSDGLSEIIKDALLLNLALNETSEELREFSGSSLVAQKSSNSLGSSFLFGGSSASFFSAAVSKLTLSLGALLASGAAIIAIGGALIALLSQVGKSGNSAESILQKLKTVVFEIGDTIFPIFITAGETIIDIVKSLVVVFKEVFVVFQDVAEEMGFISQSIDEGGSAFEQFVGVLESLVSFLKPIIDGIGKLAINLATRLVPAIRRAGDFLVSLADALRIEEILTTFSRAIAISTFYIEEMGFTIDSVVGIISDIISGTVKMIAILGVLTVAAIVAAGGTGLLNYQIASLVALLSTLFSPITAILAVIGALIGAVGFIGEKMGLWDGIINLLIDSVVFLVNILREITGAIASVIDGIVDAITSFSEMIGLTGGIITIADIFIELGEALSDIAEIYITINSLIAEFLGILIKIGVQKTISDLASAAEGLFNAFMKIDDVFASALDKLLKFLGAKDEVSNFVALFERLAAKASSFASNIISAAVGIIRSFEKLPEIIDQTMTNVLKGLTNFINSLIDKINESIDKANNIPGVNVDKVGKVEFDEDTEQALRESAEASKEQSKVVEESNIDREDVGVGGSVLKETGVEGVRMLGGGMADINIEDKVEQNYDQTINADPEDKGKLSRTVKDAISQANDLNRRRQGGTRQ